MTTNTVAPAQSLPPQVVETGKAATLTVSTTGLASGTYTLSCESGCPTGVTFSTTTPSLTFEPSSAGVSSAVVALRKDGVVVRTMSLRFSVPSRIFYVSSAGNDGNDGLTPATAFASPGKVNSLDLEPGDAVLFQGGATFAGNLTLDAADTGTALAPVVVGSYGAGRAQLHNTTDIQGVSLLNPQHLHLANLDVVGPSGTVTPTQDGITVRIENAGASAPGQLQGLVLEDLDIAGYRSGLVFYNASSSPTSGTTGAIARNLAISNVLEDGVSFSVSGGNEGSASWVSTTLERVRVTGVAGTAGAAGFGIGLRYGQNFTIRQCEISAIGTLATGQGGRGIDVFLVSGAVIEDCEVADTRKATAAQGGQGVNVSRSSGLTFRRNFVRATEGRGFNVYVGGTETVDDVVLAFNVFENASTANVSDPASLSFHGATGGTLSNVLLAHNTVYLASATQATAGLWVKENVSNFKVVNNIFVTSGAAAMGWRLSPDPDLRTEGNTLFHTGLGNVLEFNPWYTSNATSPFYKGGELADTLAEVRLAGTRNTSNAVLGSGDAVVLESLAGAVSDPKLEGLQGGALVPLPVGTLGVLGADRDEKLEAYAPSYLPGDPAASGAIGFDDLGLAPSTARLGTTDARGRTFTPDTNGYALIAGALQP